MARRSRRRFTRGNREYVWCSVLLDESGATGVAQGGVVVATSDWFAGDGARHCTLLRIRGWLVQAVTTAATGSAMDTAFNYIAKFGGDETAESPAAVTAYTDEDILWSDGAPCRTVIDATSGYAFSDAVVTHVDVKAKRKLSQNDSVSLVSVLNSTSGSRTMVTKGVLRGLVQLS